MREQRIVLSLAILIGGVAVPGVTLAEEYRGTLAQQMACTPDVFRLCSEQMPDVSRIVACLRQNTPQLGEACRAVFESNASMPQPNEPRGRPAQPRPYE